MGRSVNKGHRADAGPPRLKVRGASVTQRETAHERANPQPLSPGLTTREASGPGTSSTVSLEPHCPLLLLVDMAGTSELRLSPEQIDTLSEKPVIICGLF